MIQQYPTFLRVLTASGGEQLGITKHSGKVSVDGKVPESDAAQSVV